MSGEWGSKSAGQATVSSMGVHCHLGIGNLPFYFGAKGPISPPQEQA